MIITWLGHSCFLIETISDKKILIDPYNPILGKSPYKGSIDIVTISHDHIDHNYTKDLNPGFITLNTPEAFEKDDIKINGIPTFHDDVRGYKRGENIIYIFEADNLRLCHLGDLGHMLSDEIINLIGPIDVLFVPIDHNFTLDAETAYSLCKKIQSKIVLPMHYKSSKLAFPGDGIEKFIALMKNAMNLNSDTLILDTLPSEKNQLKILQL